MAMKKKAAAKKAAAGPKPRTQKDLKELAPMVRDQVAKGGRVKVTLGDALAQLVQADKAEPGQTGLALVDLVVKYFEDVVASAKGELPLKAKTRTKKELTELAKKIVHGAPALKLTEAQALEKLTAADKKKPGQLALQLARDVWSEETARKVLETLFSEPKKGAQQSLPRSRPTGAALTQELCNLEIKLRKDKAAHGLALAELEGAKAAVKDAESKVAKTQDAIAECLYDLRSGQGRIEFPEKPAADGQAA